jgi:hypothetical protein
MLTTLLLVGKDGNTCGKYARKLRSQWFFGYQLRVGDAFFGFIALIQFSRLSTA